MCFLSVFTQVNAASGTGSLYLNLTMVGRRSGYGYQIASGSKNVWKIYETGKNTDDTIYCLRGGPGFGSADYSAIRAPVETHYTKYFDLRIQMIFLQYTKHHYQMLMVQNIKHYYGF